MKFPWFKNKRKPRDRRPALPSGKRHFEGAIDSRMNRRTWENAGNQDPDTLLENSLPKLRNRSRYVTRNAPYADGIALTLAQDVVGTGVRIHLGVGGNRATEMEQGFSKWMDHCDFLGQSTLADMMQTAVLGFIDTGEAIFVKTLDSTAVGSKLKILMIEPDRLDTPWDKLNDKNITMGVESDDLGRPVAYWINQNHPGDSDIGMDLSSAKFDRVPADQVIHLFRKKRPGQTRGFPWIASSLDMFANIHKYTNAVVVAAEHGASFAWVIESSGDNLDPDDAVEDLDPIEIPYGTLMTLPAGYTMSQLKAEQPAARFDMAMKLFLGEAARPLNVPLNIAMANSAGYNFASGRLDHQIYRKHLAVIRKMFVNHLLNILFADWAAEQRFLFQAAAMNRDQVDPTWYWDGPAVAVDPVKEATAQKIRLQNKTTSLTAEAHNEGRDPDATLQQIKKEVAALEDIGIVHPAAEASAGQPPDESEPEPDTDEDEGGDDVEVESSDAA